MSLFGPVYSPAEVVNTAVENPQRAMGQMVVNAAVDAVEQAINPSPEQKAQEERAREEQGRKDAEKREKDQQTHEEQQRLLLEAQRQQQIILESRNDPAALTTTNKAAVLGRVGPERLDDGIAFDSAAVELEAQRQRVVQEILRDDGRQDGAVAVSIPGLDGLAPEIPLKILSGAGVIRLSLQEAELAPELANDPRVDKGQFIREDVVAERDGGKRIRVRLDFADGTHVNTELDFKPAESQESEGPEVVGRIERQSPGVARVAA